MTILTSICRLFVIFFLSLIAIALEAQTKVAFSADIQAGCEPLFVKFTNLSQPIDGSIYFWDFGNGKVSNAVNAQSTYTQAGSYTVKLVMTNGLFKDSVYFENYIQVMKKPTPSFYLQGDTIGCAPFTANLINQTTDANGVTLSYIWSLGDGNISTDINPSILYSNGGSFDVSLLATNQHGCSQSFTMDEAIHVLDPIPQFGADKTYSCNGKLLVKFNNLTVSPIDYTTVWTFGNSSSSTVNSPTHLYQQIGNYTVGLTVTDTFGCVGKTEVVDLIRIAKTTSSFTSTADTLCIGQPVLFTNNSINGHQAHWAFGDGLTSTSYNATKVYNKSGDYQVTLISSNGTCADTSKMLLNVEFVKASFAVSDSFICELPKVIGYRNLSQNAVSYDWQFGSGAQSTNINPDVNYTAASMPIGLFATSFNDTLIARSKNGCVDKIIKPHNITIHLPKVLMELAKDGSSKTLSGCIPMTLLLNNMTEYHSDYDSIISQTWILPNGNHVATPSVAVEVTEAGRLPIQLNVTTARGCVQSQLEYINAGNRLELDFAVVGSSVVCASKPVDFIITKPNVASITQYAWTFGDETVGTVKDLSITPHEYKKTGLMDVTLDVYNYGCKSSITKKKLVNVLGPIVTAKRQLDCNKPYEHQFIGEIMDASSFSWNFGDGSANETTNTKPIHTYATKGNYIINLQAFNTSTGCSDHYSLDSKVKDVKSIISPISTNICADSEVILDGSASVDVFPFAPTGTGEGRKYLWLFGNATKPISTDNIVSITFKNNGIVPIKLVTSDVNECQDTAQFILHVFKPNVDFQSDYKLGCMPVTFGFKDLTQSDTTIASWGWTFGDNTTSIEQNPTHDYTTFGRYSVALKVTDVLGCNSLLNKGQHVTAVYPKPSFFATDFTLCQGDSTRYIDNSEGLIIERQWDFGGMDYSTEASPLRLYADTGRFTVSLNVIDDHGCKASLTRSDYIKVQGAPEANFISDGNGSSCYPYLVQFTDKSISPYLQSRKWIFGENSNVSTLQNPFFMYQKPGKHDITLISYTSNGCSDTITKKGFIDVQGPYARIEVLDTLCLNTNTPFVASEQLNVYDLQWDFGDGHSASGDSAWHRYDHSGNYNPLLFLRTDSINSCNKLIADSINVLDLRADFGTKDQITSGCPPFDVNFINRSLNADSWQWDFGNGHTSLLRDPHEQFVNSKTYNIQLIAKHHLGCSDTLTGKQVTVFPLPTIGISPDTLICIEGKAMLYATGGSSYKWHPAQHLSSPLQANTTAEPTADTRYWVVVTGQNDCVDSAYTNVIVQQKPILTLTDTTIIIGESVAYDLNDDAISTYYWTPDLGLSCVDCSNPVASPLNTTNYLISVTDTSHCFTKTYPLIITVQHKFSVDIPNAFTPNGDQVNDVIYVKGWGLQELISFTIYNRFGQVVFQSSDFEYGWDGTFKGHLQPIETYQYVVQVRTHAQTVLSKTGSIMLIR